MTDEINSPSHYMLFPDMEAIDVIKAALTPEEFAGYCKGNALKYRLRAGEKGPVEKCIAKACWYQNKLREVTRADFGQQNTIDCSTDAEKGGSQLDKIERRFHEAMTAGGAVCNDPRTVVGLDVSFETEKHMNFAPEPVAGEWIEWKGGSMPVAGTARVDIRTRDAGECLCVGAEEWLWGHSETGEDEGDIVAYRLSAEASHA